MEVETGGSHFTHLYTEVCRNGSVEVQGLRSSELCGSTATIIRYDFLSARQRRVLNFMYVITNFDREP